MSALPLTPAAASVEAPRTLRFGATSSDGEAASVLWLLKQNCSLAPRQLLGVFLSLCMLSLAISTFFWFQGATLVLPFAWLEMLALGIAFAAYSRHAADRESIRLQAATMTIERSVGQRVERTEFALPWVRITAAAAGGARSLIEVSGAGRSVAIGRFVRPEHRLLLRRELIAELRRAVDAAHRPAYPTFYT